MKIKRIPIGSYVENCYLLIDEDTLDTIVIDPGEGIEKVIDSINSLKLNVKMIIITHGHFDHTNGLKTLKDAFNVKAYMNLSDLPHVVDGDLIDESISDGDTFKLGDTVIKAIATPGHTLGGMCFYFDNSLISGDTLFKDSIGRTDMLGGDYVTIINSIKTKLLTLPDDTVVYPGHGFSTTIGREKVANPFLR